MMKMKRKKESKIRSLVINKVKYSLDRRKQVIKSGAKQYEKNQKWKQRQKKMRGGDKKQIIPSFRKKK